jgi:hypothetical protein
MQKRFFKHKLQGSTLVEVLVSTVIIMSVFFVGSTLIVDTAVKKPISNDLKIELNFLSEYHKNPSIVEKEDTLQFLNYYVVNKHYYNENTKMLKIDVELYSASNYLVARHYFLRENVIKE